MAGDGDGGGWLAGLEVLLFCVIQSVLSQLNSIIDLIIVAGCDHAAISIGTILFWLTIKLGTAMGGDNLACIYPLVDNPLIA
ncbi:hypothetical protein NX79_11560 [Xanthomonas vasicola]|nr:hypothetical protein NX04_15220 [Xanthomonas vasicola]KGR60239.1 hypothetical protein NX79_11560 [Xanthomonas vasicola]